MSREQRLIDFEKEYGKDCTCPALYHLATIEHLEEYESLKAKNETFKDDLHYYKTRVTTNEDYKIPNLEAENKRLREALEILQDQFQSQLDADTPPNTKGFFLALQQIAEQARKGE